MYRHTALSVHPEHQYLDLLRDLLWTPPRQTRNDDDTRSIFGRQMIFDLAHGFPLLTTKKLPFGIIAKELLWFLSGSTNVRSLQEQGVRIWDEWADAEGELGPVYGAQWRSWAAPDGRGIDQVANVLRSLCSDPHGRRHIVSAWNPADIPDMALPPCHVLFQFYVENDGRLSLRLDQRSADVFLGLPFNIASYSLLLCMTAHVLGRAPGRFIWQGGDVHLYGNHVEPALAQVDRAPRPFPYLVTSGNHADLDDWSLDDLAVHDYDPHPHIAAAVSK